MPGHRLSFIFMLALLLGCIQTGSFVHAASDEYDFADGVDEGDKNYNFDNNSKGYLYTSVANATGVFDQIHIGGGPGDTNVNLVVGDSSRNDGKSGTVVVNGAITVETGGSSLNVTGPQSGGDFNLTIGGNLSFQNGGAASFGGGNSTVTVEAGILAASGNNNPTTLNFNKNSTVTFNSAENGKLGGTEKAHLNLNGGKLGFGSRVTLVNGDITLGADSVLAVKGGLTVNNATNRADAKIVVGSHDLTILNELGNPDWLGTLTIGGSAGGGGTLSMGGGTLTVGDLIFDNGSVMDAGASGGKINTDTLLVTEDTDFRDSVNVDTIVGDLTTIESGAVYTVSGTKNEYHGGILAEGTLRGGLSATTITLGTGGTDRAPIVVDGGSIAAGSGTFTIKNADIAITKAGANDTIDASIGALDLKTSTITVSMSDSTPATIVADKGIDVKSYLQLEGNVELSTIAGGKAMTVEEPVIIGSSQALEKVNLDVLGNAANFRTGLTLDRYGSVSAAKGDGVVTVGDGSIVGRGNNQLYAATGNTLTFKNDSGKEGRMQWNGFGNTVYGNVDQSGFGVTVAEGARLTAAAAGTKGYEVGSLTVHGRLDLGAKDTLVGGSSGSVITTSGNIYVKNGGTINIDYGPALVANAGDSSNLFRVEKGGILRANTNSITANGFKSVNIDGTYVAGLLDGDADPVESAHLVADSDINVSSSALVTITAGLAAAVTSGSGDSDSTILLEVTNSAGSDNRINYEANLGSTSMLGKFKYALNGDSTILYIADVSGKVVLDGSDKDREQALENLQDMWGKNQIKEDLGNVIYDVIKGDIVADPEDSPAGNKNINLLTSIGSPEGQFVGVDTLEYLNGAHLYGITDVAIETNRTFVSGMANRAKALGCSFMAAGEVSGSDAWASTAMNPVLNNRFWLGGSGMVQDAGTRDGFSGYKYKSLGFVGGYDRVVAQNMAGGVSFAYNKGDYEDKGTARSDSEIESFSVGLYGTYANPNGFFVSGHGGYTYSSNDIRELRRDPDAGRYSWAESDFRTNTWSLGALFGYDLRLPCDGLVITPSVGLNYIGAKNSDHSSFLDGIATQRVVGAKNHAVYAPLELGIQYDRELGPQSALRVEVDGGYAYNFYSSGMKGRIHYIDLSPETSISLHGPENTKHSFKIGGGARYAYRAFDLGFRYDYVSRSNYTAHRLMASAGFSF